MKIIELIKRYQLVLYIMAFQIFTFFVTDPKSTPLLYARVGGYIIMDLIILYAIRVRPKR